MRAGTRKKRRMRKRKMRNTFDDLHEREKKREREREPVIDINDR